MATKALLNIILDKNEAVPSPLSRKLPQLIGYIKYISANIKIYNGVDGYRI